MAIPTTDKALDTIISYVASALNTAASPDIAVASYSIWASNLESTANIPALQIYRLSSTGKNAQECRAEILYIVSPYSTPEQLAGHMRWAEVRIFEALERLGFTAQTCISVAPETLQSKYGIGRLQDVTFPALRIPFSFMDYESI